MTTMQEESGETPPDANRVAETEVKDDFTFLAREFLTWLAYHAETAGGAFPGGGDILPFTIAFAGRLVLRTPAGQVTDLAMRGPSPGGSPDLRYALAGGLAVKEADLQLEQGEILWTFALAAEHFDLKRCKLPALLDEESDDPANERMKLLGQLDANLEHAYGHFLAIRGARQWVSEVVPAMRAWLDEGT